VTGTRIDWDAARERLAAAEGALGSTELSEADRDAMFLRRAEALAAPATPGEPADAFQALVFRLADEWYALPSWQVREVRALSDLTALPGVPEFIAGLVNVRGRVITALDLRPFFGLRGAGGPLQTIMLVAASQGDIALLTSDPPTLRWLRDGDLGPLPAGGPARLDASFVRGVTTDLVVVLDAERILADQRMLIQDDV
jgi:purine-binding chemotaxis protein CheW